MYSLQVIQLQLVSAFSIRPFVGEAAVVRCAVRGCARSALVRLFCRFSGRLVAYLGIASVSYTLLVLYHVSVVLYACQGCFSIVRGGLSVVQVCMVVVLGVVLVVQ